MNIHLGLLILIVALALLAGGAGGWLVARDRFGKERLEYERSLAAAREQAVVEKSRSERLLEANADLVDRARSDAGVLTMLSPLAAQLDQVNAKVQTLEVTAASQHSQIVSQLRREAELTTKLSETASSLNAALRSTSARGNWGEVQLRRIIEAAGMLERVDFDTQVVNASSNGSGSKRPDVVIHLPGGGHIPIDAKAPMDSYILAQEISASDVEHAAERNELLMRHARAVRSHVNALIKRNYPADYPDSPQLTVLFLPSEALLSEAVESDGQLLDYSLKNGIVLTSPSSLLALLRSIAAVWTSAAASAEARDIVDLGRTLVDRIGVVVTHLDKLGKSLGSSITHYNAAVSSLESRLLVTARSFDSLSGTLPPPREILSDDAQIRQVTSPELTPTEEESA